uniref:BTB domain-containing protein n=1 Tax=Anopheles farauti TaxID=69004 RepID=A0A182QN14_9DIPT
MSKMTRYAEAKSVKVDNWGVFFLQKLQNFFNKTDHCDLTLQFNDNSQLKVHRLVLSACTDYFNHLENVCEMYDDVLIMPMDLQADVIVPIVNFMYTGTLEFQYNMYDRLLKTATDMNMTVLLKLLEAHRQTSRIAKQPVLLNKQAPRPRTGATMYQGQQRAGVPVARGPMISGKPRLPMVGRQQQPPHSYGKAANAKPGPSRYVDEMGDGYDDSFDGMSYEGKPLLTADQVKKEEETSPFEKLRKGYTNANVVKRASGGSLTSPPAKKPNLDEVKEFTEAARMRSQLTTDDDDSPDYVDDDTHFNDDDDEDYQPPASVKAALAKQASASGGSGKQIVIKQESKSPGSGGGGGGGGSNVLKQITVKDDSGNVDHAKIISEVLKKYPHLVKKNKNIKLKIMQKPSSNAASASTSTSTPSATKMEVRTATPLKQDQSMVRRATANIQNEPAAKASTSGAGGTASSSATPGTKPASSAPKTIDAKTMHALIAKGAENMTGPWLCLRCGINGRPISIPSYRAFRNHLVTKHKERIDVRICEHCGWRAQQRNPHLFYHLLTEHNIRQTVKFPKCDECDHVAMTAEDLQKHEEVVHARGGDLQQCIYCNKVFAKEMDLYDHMKEQHRERAIVEGVLEFTDDEEYHTEEEQSTSAGKANDGKIKILSNITLPPAKTSGTARTLEPSSEAEAMSNVASGIATSLTLVGDNGVVLDDANFQNQFAIEAEMASVHGENATGAAGAEGGESIPKLVTADGTELQLTQSQKDEIISQLQGSGGGNDVVMVLNEDNFSVGSTIQLGEGVQIVDATSQNIMLMYSQPGEGGSEHNDSQKSDTKADVTASEDDNSQASVALSEDKDASIDEKQTSLGEADESQESRRTDVSDKQHEGEEYDGNTTADDVDMSGHETSETNETLQQAVKDELMDTEEHDEEAKAEDEASEKAASAKDDDSEERQQSDKLRLISELEGDWSEDTAEEQPTAAVASEASKKAPSEKKPTVAPVAKPAPKQQDPAVKKPTTAVGATKPDPAAGTKKKPSSETSPGGSVAERKKTGEEKAGAAGTGKQLDTLLDDWNQDVKHEESFETESDADLEKAMEKVTNAPKDEGKAKESKRDSTAQQQNDDDDGTVAAVVVKTEQVTDDTNKKEESKKNGTKGAGEPPVRSKPDASELEDEEEEDDDELDEEGKEKSSSKSKEH